MNDNFDNEISLPINIVWALLHEIICKQWEENNFLKCLN